MDVCKASTLTTIPLLGYSPSFSVIVNRSTKHHS
uniref:Uncharacterized protein n=1 Tax=Arundo donax TaxID=35708 RepID=A0A0A8ZSF6_ARUDO